MENEELRVTAELAEIGLSESELQSLGVAVSELVRYFATMMEADLEELEPTTHALMAHNRTRVDEPSAEPEATAESLLENAPELEDRFIVIPNVL